MAFLHRNVESNFGLVRQLRIGQVNTPGCNWAGCSKATMLKMTNFLLSVIFSEILVKQLPDLPDPLQDPCFNTDEVRPMHMKVFPVFK